MRLADLSVTLDDGTAVVKDAEVVIAPGERVLGACPSNRRFLLAREGRVRFCLAA
jgi:hypothetical protein